MSILCNVTLEFGYLKAKAFTMCMMILFPCMKNCMRYFINVNCKLDSNHIFNRIRVFLAILINFGQFLQAKKTLVSPTKRRIDSLEAAM